MSSSYAPREGSVTWKVIQYLTTNPTEHLSAEVISAKFDCTRTNVHTLLAQAVQAELLKRTDDGEDGELVYRIGDGHPSITASAARAPSLAAAMAAIVDGKGQAPEKPLPAAPTGEKVRAKPFQIDLATVAIEKGVPLAPAKTKVPVEWPLLLNKLEVGDSFALPVEGRNAINTAMTAYRKATGKTLVCRTVDGGGLRVWRTE